LKCRIQEDISSPSIIHEPFVAIAYLYNMFLGATPKISSSYLLKEGMVRGKNPLSPGRWGEHFLREPSCFFPSLYVYGNGKKFDRWNQP
jgi:hypothetical protein